MIPIPSVDDLDDEVAADEESERRALLEQLNRIAHSRDFQGSREVRAVVAPPPPSSGIPQRPQSSGPPAGYGGSFFGPPPPRQPVAQRNRVQPPIFRRQIPSRPQVPLAATSLPPVAAAAARPFPSHNVRPGMLRPPGLREIVANPAMSKNPAMRFVKDFYRIRYEERCVPDFMISPTATCSYLDLEYHAKHPSFLTQEIVAPMSQMPRSPFRQRFLILYYNDRTEGQTRFRGDRTASQFVAEVESACLRAQMTFLMAFTMAEVGRWLVLMKHYQHKSTSVLEKRARASTAARLGGGGAAVSKVDQRLAEVLPLCGGGVNSKSDGLSLRLTFGSVRRIFQAKEADLMQSHGLGPKKCKALFSVFTAPFRAQQ